MSEVVLLDEGSAVRELHAHSFKISGSDHAPVSGNAFPGLLGGGVIGIRSLRAAAAEWETIDDADGIDTGNRAYFILQFSSEVDDAFKFGIAIEGDVHPHGENVGGVEAGARAFQAEEAANQEAGAEQEHQGERDF